MIHALIVGLFGVAALILSGRFDVRLLIRLGVGGALIAVCLFMLPGTSDARNAFTHRWDRSTTDRGGVQATIVVRLAESLFSPFETAPLIGYGTGISTIVGQKLATAKRVLVTPKASGDDFLPKAVCSWERS